MHFKQIGKNVAPFIPLLILYLIMIIVFAPEGLVADEGRYIAYAENLVKGYYADSTSPSIRNGPGYPIVLYLPVLFKTAHIFMRLLNLLFITIALVYFFKTLCFYITKKQALILCYIFGLYPPLVRGITGILSETFAILLICGFVFYFIKIFNTTENTRKNVALASLFLGGLALTKFLFGYVILALILGSLILLVFNRSRNVKLGILTLFLGFTICLPYLAYTYGLTGKMFLWGTQGGEMLYWRSTPFENEYGDWISPDVIVGNIPSKYCDIETLRSNHGEFIKEVSKHSALEQDELYKAKAIENIKNHPTKYLQNTLASGFRLFYNYPFTYIPLKPSNYFYLIPNTFLIVFLILCYALGLYHFKHVSYEIRFLGIAALLFMGGLILLDGRVRHLLPIVPVLIILFTRIISQFIRVDLKELKQHQIN